MEVLMDKLSFYGGELLAWSPKLIGALLALFIGLWIANRISSGVSKLMTKSGLDRDLVPFLSSIISVLLKVMVILSVAGMVGIETTSFIALLGAVGLAVGMALQGTLGHLASGVMVMIFKPYRVGDLVDLQGVVGTVEEIQIFNTVIKSLENKKVIIPNGIATSGIMTNLSATEHLRVDLNVAMPYEEDFDKVQEIIKGALAKTPGVLTTPAPTIEIEKFQEHNILLAVRPHATTANYWGVYFGAYKNIKAAFGNNNIKVAYPVREVKMTNSNN